MKKNVPELRFKEFNDEWRNETIGNIADVTKLAGFEFTKYVKYSDEGEKIALRGLNVKNGKINLTDVKFIDESDFSKLNRSKLYINDLLLTYVGTIGELAIIDEDNRYYLAPNVCRLRFFKDNSIFLKSVMSSEKFYNKTILPSVTTSSQPALSMENIRLLKVIVPSLQEQEKIADFFTILDNLIEEQDGKVRDLETYKKGMMQKIFSQEIRFKDENGCDYPEWEERKLGEISRIIMGQSPSSTAYNENKEGIPLIQGNADISNRLTTPRMYTSGITKLCELHDIIMSVRAPVGTIAIANQVCCIGRGVCAIKSNLNQKYLYQVLLEKENKWSKLSQGSTFESINSNDIKALVVKTPSIQEQKKIAEFLSDIDNLIEEEKKNLDDLREMKKGLLQQMFV